MKQSVNVYDFIQAFEGVRPDNFTRQGLIALFNYLEMLDEDCGTETELDVIALCCDFSEYESLEELQQNYNNIESLEELEQHTTVIYLDKDNSVDSGFIIHNF